MKPSIAFTALLSALALAAPAAAFEAQPYDGSIPFDCELQQAGMGVDFPDPDADPFCVQYDKTDQNLTGLGLVEFLALEPARVAAAVDKCFYFQRDEWRGSVLEDGEHELWHWTGSYWFDKANGRGGAYIEDARLLGQGPPPTWTDFAPAPFAPYVHPTGAGGSVSFDYPADPRCAA